jgi:SAM-dependent methyltransferase
MNRDELNQKSRDFFESLWRAGDRWEFETSGYEHRRYDHLIGVIGDRRYSRALEIGCGAGAFSKRLIRLTDSLVALDISPTAIEAARASVPGVDFRVANVMDFDVRADGPWDLIVVTETVYYLGWLYSYFDVGWVFSEIYAAMAANGRLLLADTQGCATDMLTLPWYIRGYHDLMVNLGFRVEREEVRMDRKHDVGLEVLITLLVKDQAASTDESTRPATGQIR